MRQAEHEAGPGRRGRVLGADLGRGGLRAKGGNRGAWSGRRFRSDFGKGCTGSGEGTTGVSARSPGALEGSRARILPFSKGRGVGVRRREEESGVSPEAMMASSSWGRGEGRSGSEKWGIGGISMGSRTGLIVVGKEGGEMNSMKPLMTVSRP